MSVYETAPFEVIKTYPKKIELRKYPTLYMASTKTRIDNRMSSGFNNVFQYISGYNEEDKKISMTTPVVSKIENNILTTQFLVPSKFGANPPKPKGDLVTIETIEEGLYMVIKFSGSWNESHFNEMDQKLVQAISDFGYSMDSNRMVLRYQPPFVPGFLRKNEIMYKVIKQNID